MNMALPESTFFLEVLGRTWYNKSWVKISYTEHTPGRMVMVKNTLNCPEISAQFSFSHLTLKSLKVLFSCIALIILHQGVLASDLILTAESDKPAYALDETALFTGTLKNVSQETIWIYGDVEYSFTIFRDSVQVWKWSLWRCG